MAVFPHIHYHMADWGSGWGQRQGHFSHFYPLSLANHRINSYVLPWYMPTVSHEAIPPECEWLGGALP